MLDVFDGPALLRDGWGAGADLTGANLARANLARANLSGAYLDGAYLSGAIAGRFTRWPDRFNPAARGVNVR